MQRRQCIVIQVHLCLTLSECAAGRCWVNNLILTSWRWSRIPQQQKARSAILFLFQVLKSTELILQCTFNTITCLHTVYLFLRWLLMDCSLQTYIQLLSTALIRWDFHFCTFVYEPVSRLSAVSTGKSSMDDACRSSSSSTPAFKSLRPGGSL